MNRDAFEDLVAAIEALHLGGDDADGMTGAGQRGRLQPHPPVERHRQILHHD